MLDKNQFERYVQQGYTAVPMVLEVLADLDTPLSTFLKLSGGRYSYLLESVQGGEVWGRYSVIGLPCSEVIRIYGNKIEVEDSGQLVQEERSSDPLAWIEDRFSQHKVVELVDLPMFYGGYVGYFGYDTVRLIEPRLKNGAGRDELSIPDILLMRSEELVVFDNLRGKLFIIVLAHCQGSRNYDWAIARLNELRQNLRQQMPMNGDFDEEKKVADEQDFVSGFTQQAFEEAVARCKEYILAGDVMQVVLSQRLSLPFNQAPLDLYRALRTLNPSPYMFYLDLGEFSVVGASPEVLVRRESERVTVRPIAGTRPRGRDEAEDLALEQDLLADPKEIAEHLMLIDLGRNDIGRIAKIGEVTLTEKMVIERYSHVMHIVSNVQGMLRDDCALLDPLRATFPMGTLTGAPKVRAMEIIDEFEPVKRGLYGGAVGYIAWSGNMDTAIAIRTVVIKQQQLYLQVGAGIVADSVPQKEWEETMNKGRAIVKAVQLAQKGLN